MERMRPGKEIPPDYKKVVVYLIDVHEWRYIYKGNHPKLYPPDTAMGQISVPTTPGDVRSWRNFVAQVKRTGVPWPPPGKGSKNA